MWRRWHLADVDGTWRRAVPPSLRLFYINRKSCPLRMSCVTVLNWQWFTTNWYNVSSNVDYLAWSCLSMGRMHDACRWHRSHALSSTVDAIYVTLWLSFWSTAPTRFQTPIHNCLMLVSAHVKKTDASCFPALCINCSVWQHMSKCCCCGSKFYYTLLIFVRYIFGTLRSMFNVITRLVYLCLPVSTWMIPWLMRSSTFIWLRVTETNLVQNRLCDVYNVYCHRSAPRDVVLTTANPIMYI